MGTSKSNLEKKSWMIRNIEANFIQGIEIDEEKFISYFCYNNQSTPKTAKEMLKMFENIGKIIRRDGKIIEPPKQ